MKKHIFLLSAALLLAFSTSFANNPTSANATDATVKVTDYCGVTSEQIYAYMLDQGYITSSMYQVQGTCNVIVKTTIGKCFVVYIQDSAINGYEDSDF